MYPFRQTYTHMRLTNDLKQLGISFFTIGKSLSGRDLYLFKIGNGAKQIFINGAHHGAEWLTAPCLVRFAEDCQQAMQKNRRLCEFNVKALSATATLHILPMVNPDGIEISAHNPEKVWQSNARGVDLNHNYDAGFSAYKKLEKEQGITAGTTRYSGMYPESEPEIRAVCDYVRSNAFDMCIALHSQGEVIYYDYGKNTPPCSYSICKALCAESGYLPDKTEGFASYGGLNDWFVTQYKKPAFTIEIGKGKNPLPGYLFDSIYQKVLPMLLLASFLG